jgi:hypothetical protein
MYLLSVVPRYVDITVIISVGIYDEIHLKADACLILSLSFHIKGQSI